MPLETSPTPSTGDPRPSDARTLDGTLDGVTDPGSEVGSAPDSIADLLREVAAAPARPLGSAAALERGEVVGDTFRIEDTLGAGGMGVVYLARDVELDRQVAIKVRSGAAHEGDIARMLREAKVMAQLSHPNVVTVYEVGTHGGQLFIAMEYVDAGSLRAWLKGQPRGWREIVDLFMQAGRGLAAAHALGLVHRDFKPDNVLVDRTGRARVADFGVARLAESAAPAADLRSLETSSLGERLTRTGATVGTPAYMAPEQFIGGEIGPAADQFAFCVSLHEALWGQRPYSGRDVNELIAAVALERVVTPKSGDVPTWVRRVVLRGLRAAPEDRWPTMDALVAALARDPAERRRRLVFAGAALVATSAGGWWAAEQGDVAPCSGTDAKIVEVWSPSRRQALADAFEATGLPHAAAARATVETALDDYTREWSGMAKEACEATRLRGEQSEALMDRRMSCLAERASALEGIVRVLVTGEHKVVDDASSLVATLPSLRRCEDTERLLEGVAPPDDPATAEAVSSLRARLSEYATLARARIARDAVGEIPALVAEAEATGYAPLVTEAIFVQAQLEDDRGDSAAAERDFDTALWQAIRIGHDELVPRIAIKLAFAIGYSRSDRDQGERLLRLAEATVDEDGSPEQRANIEAVRGAIALHAADYAAAETAYRARLTLEEELHGAEHPHVADALGTLAAMLDTLGRFDEAAGAYERAIGIAEGELGPDHPRVGTLVGDLAVHTSMKGDAVGSVPLFQRALAIEERALGVDAPALVSLLTNLAKSQMMVKDLDGAETTLARAVAIIEKADGPESIRDARLLEARSLLASRRERWQECFDLNDAARAAIERQLGPEHPSLATGLANGAHCLFELGRTDDSLARLRRALALREKADGERSEAVAQVLSLIAQTQAELGHHDEVVAACDRGIAILEELGRQESPHYERMVSERDAARAKVASRPRE
jgi:tetratricopeptide (TPR) repeat protein/predicted Ser/Thr protein kinase